MTVRDHTPTKPAPRSLGQKLLDLRRLGALTPRERMDSLVPVVIGAVLLGVAIALGLGQSLIAIALGVGVAAVYFIGANRLIDLFGDRWAERLRPWVFIGPAVAFLTLFLLLPALRTIYLSLFDRSGDSFVGLENYQWAFSSEDIQNVFINNLLWLVGVTFFSTAVGLAMAVLADRIKYEAAAKALVFLPLAISFVGAGVIWRFVYAFQPAGDSQIGLLNALWTGLGNDPVAWLVEEPWNNFFLIWIMIWMQTGFAMVILSAAIKAVPTELIEAARIDGANELQVFRNITIPSIKGALIVVVTTTIILVLKVFDIVRVTTSGEFNTNVLANEMVAQLQFGNFHQGSALAVVLFIAVIPILVYNIRQFRREGGI